MVNFQVIKKLFVNPVKNKTAGPKWVAYAKPHFTKPRLSFSSPQTESSASLSEQPSRDSFSRLPGPPPAILAPKGRRPWHNQSAFCWYNFLVRLPSACSSILYSPAELLSSCWTRCCWFVNHRIKSVRLKFTQWTCFFTPQNYFFKLPLFGRLKRGRLIVSVSLERGAGNLSECLRQ